MRCSGTGQNNCLEQFRSQKWCNGLNKFGSRSWSISLGQWGAVDRGNGGNSGISGCNGGCVWVGWVSILGSGVFIRDSRVSGVSHVGGVSIRVSDMMSIWVVMGSQMSTSMVVDKGWVGFSFGFGFTLDKMMVGCLGNIEELL